MEYYPPPQRMAEHQQRLIERERAVPSLAPSLAASSAAAASSATAASAAAASSAAATATLTPIQIANQNLKNAYRERNTIDNELRTNTIPSRRTFLEEQRKQVQRKVADLRAIYNRLLLDKDFEESDAVTSSLEAVVASTRSQSVGSSFLDNVYTWALSVPYDEVNKQIYNFVIKTTRPHMDFEHETGLVTVPEIVARKLPEWTFSDPFLSSPIPTPRPGWIKEEIAHADIIDQLVQSKKDVKLTRYSEIAVLKMIDLLKKLNLLKVYKSLNFEDIDINVTYSLLEINNYVYLFKNLGYLFKKFKLGLKPYKTDEVDNVDDIDDTEEFMKDEYNDVVSYREITDSSSTSMFKSYYKNIYYQLLNFILFAPNLLILKHKVLNDDHISQKFKLLNITLSNTISEFISTNIEKFLSQMQYLSLLLKKRPFDECKDALIKLTIKFNEATRLANMIHYSVELLSLMKVGNKNPPLLEYIDNTQGIFWDRISATNLFKIFNKISLALTGEHNTEEIIPTSSMSAVSSSEAAAFGQHRQITTIKGCIPFKDKYCVGIKHLEGGFYFNVYYQGTPAREIALSHFSFHRHTDGHSQYHFKVLLKIKNEDGIEEQKLVKIPFSPVIKYDPRIQYYVSLEYNAPLVEDFYLNRALTEFSYLKVVLEEMLTLIINNFDVWITTDQFRLGRSASGPSHDDELYYNKYLKYKAKYINLKKSLNL
ncbi:hypothetical protein crov199 [Cafeteria roenbergensis virus]|uniref:Uncharacterized protein n=1 Tax=Cafeteria roenbergensis virus (strain BV-PW1) TaxID=693272 RepID=E3T4W9_CROVB|nr:hypothetical protein crov199 [Cafeteria roenbergensis virus BV-PW1]ADO67232.1 hypothetical protein crov199 [Cafeteria roenbergensis virus BV-PW1]